jgi:NhaP-type Na+/H+ and K+/H+ antiporter
MKSTHTYKSLELIYEISRDKLRYLHEIVEAQERKAATFITAISVILAMIYFLSPKEMEIAYWKLFFLIIMCPTIVIAAWGMRLCIRALRVRRYSVPPNISALRDFYIHEDPQKTMDKVVANLDEALNKNKTILESKAKSLDKVAKRILPILIVLIISSVVVRAVCLLIDKNSRQGVTVMEKRKDKPAELDKLVDVDNSKIKQQEIDKTQPDPRLRDYIYEEKQEEHKGEEDD